MNKCLFCNGSIKNKNKEHALPQWLLRNTNMMNKQYNLGFDYSKLVGNKNNKTFEDLIKSRYRFNLGNYTFPSCKECNDEYSLLESDISQIFIKFEEFSRIDSNDVSILLDWFDKIRVAIWYGQINLNGKYFGIDPNFGVDQRMALHDRYLAIWKDDYFMSELDGFDFYGTANFHFFHNPIFVGIRYKNFIFLNISHASLFCMASGTLKLKKGISLNLNNDAQLEFEVDMLPDIFNFSDLKFRSLIPKEAIEIVQLLDHPDWGEDRSFLYNIDNKFVYNDVKSLKIKNTTITYDTLMDKMDLRNKEHNKTRIHDIVNMKTHLKFNQIHKNIFNQIKDYSSDIKILNQIDLGQQDLDLYILLMNKNLEFYTESIKNDSTSNIKRVL